jgi:hypothetical protein
MHKAALLAALLTPVYFGASIGALQLLVFNPPSWLEQLISLFAAPAVILLTIWNPVLKPLGMVSGEWYTVPNLAACLLLVALYAALAYLMMRWIARLIAR